MKTFSGRDLVSAIERLLEKQAQDAQEIKQTATIRLVGEYAFKNNIQTQSGAVAAISRIVRKLDDEGVRQVRSLSDTLLNMHDEDLRSELADLRDELMPIEARVHQVKTRTAFVATVLRPFSGKYAKKWFSERTDLNVADARKRVEELENRKIANLGEFANWAKEVAGIFEELVIYRGSDAEDYYTRPAGTVNERSSRTYLQAWLSFTEKFRDEIWQLANGGPLRDAYDFKLSRSEDFQNDKNLEEPVQELAMATDHTLPKAKSERANSVAQRLLAPVRASQKVTRDTQLDWIEVYIESKANSSAQATRTWESEEDFTASLQKWIGTLPLIWGPEAEAFLAKVSVKTPKGESSLTLPNLTIADAPDRLAMAYKIQAE